MSRLESALRELEIASAALAEIDIEHLEQAHAVMDRRSLAIDAVTELAAGMPLTPAQSKETLDVLRRASETGEETQQRLAALRSAAVAELNQWTQLYRALGAGSSSGHIDFSG